MTDLKTLFNSILEPDTYKRVDETRSVDLYVGIDEISRWTLLLLCEIRPKQISSSRMIQAKVGQRDDGRWAVSLTLVSDEYREMFALFCGDIIESSRAITNKDKAARFIINRYLEWKEMLANTRDGLLTPVEIKGLLGEMYILDSELMPEYGAEKAALSWTGPRALHQDFIIDDTWYEIKTVSSGKDEVRISSIEQLDCQDSGQLIVVFADKTSKTSQNATNLNLVYTRLLSQLTDEDTVNAFCNMLLRYGYYPRPEYENEEYTFEIKGIRHYEVGGTFPCLRRNSIPAAVTKAEYGISLPAIDAYRKEIDHGTD